jgi:hypothetical protein
VAEPSDPRVLDQPWRIWPSVAVLAIVLSGALLGVVIIPIVQGANAGIDAYTAICRAQPPAASHCLGFRSQSPL